MARRTRNQARRSGSNGIPGWVWLAAGVLLKRDRVQGLLSPGSRERFFCTGNR